MQRHLVLALVAGCIVLLAACDGPAEPAIGALRVSVATTGGDLDLDGYTVAVDGGSPQSVPIDASIVVPGLATGPHDVALGSVAANCSVAGPNPGTVSVTRADTAQASFAVACLATGIRITVATTGLDIDPDGYTVSLDGSAPATLPLNGSVTISRLAAGAHQLTFGGTAANCTAGGTNPLSIDLPAGEIVAVGFPVTCVATVGVIEVTTASTGVDLDVDGYQIQLDGATSVVIAVNGTVRLGAVPGGGHSVTLTAVAANCLVGGDNPRAMSVTTGGVTRDTARTTFAVACEPTTGTARIITTTTGADLDPDGYAIGVDCYDYYGYRYCAYEEQLAANGTTLLAALPSGPHTFQIDGVAPNCVVSGGNPRTVHVSGGTTTDIVFSIACTAFASLQVTASTSGVDPDANGYTARVAGPGLDRTVDVAVNGAVTVSGMTPGSYTVTLGAVAPNCAVTGPNPRAVTVASGGTTPVAFTVTCATARQLALVSRADGNEEIYVVKSNGAGLTRLTSNPAADNDPAWSPDGSRIAFTSERDGNREIYVMNADGSGSVRLTSVPALDYAPAWSPDGSKIAFTSERDGNHEIYVMNADGSGQVRLTSDAAADHGPAWSPNGARIAFASRRDGTDEIYVMNADGSNVLRLSATGENSGPAWSPDGLQIAFHHGQCYYSCDYDLFRMNAGGSGILQLTSGDPPADTDPAWSRDGQWIAFATVSCDYYQGCYYSAIAAVKPDGSGRTEILSGPVFQPVWRP